MKAGALETYDWWDHFVMIWAWIGERYAVSMGVISIRVLK